jgi:cytochrome b
MEGRLQMSTDTRLKVWDLPTRLFHWLLAALVISAWLTAENHLMDLHRYCGYGILTLVLFRLYWGFAGSTTSRFSHFVRGPRVFFAYAAKLFKRAGNGTVGHNPMGGFSVLALLFLLLVQTVLGLFAVDTDGLESGPLARHVTFAAGRTAAELHELVFDLLYVVVILHLAAVLFYVFYKRENLVRAMVTGFRPWPAGEPKPALSFRGLGHAAIALLASAAIVAVVTKL